MKNQSITKLVLPVVRSLSAIAGLASSRSDPANPLLLSSVYVAAGSYLFWELSGSVIDDRAKRVQKTLEGALEITSQKYELKHRLLCAFSELARLKKSKIGLAVVDGPSAKEVSDPLSQAKEGLDAVIQAVEVLSQLAIFLQGIAKVTPVDQSPNFRLGVYIEHAGIMKPWASFDSWSKRTNFFKSFKNHEKHFRLSNRTDPSCVVVCAKKNSIVIVSDFESGEGTYYHDAQRTYLKSLVCFPLAGSGCQDDSRKAVLAIDSNHPNFFNITEIDNINAYLTEFALRIDLEIAVSKLLSMADAA